jgi:DNA-binding NarL/FixJ family response regulator
MPLEEVLKTWTKEGNALSKPLISAVPAQTSTLVANLTRRQYEVLRLVAKGLTNTQIAEQLVVSMRTVDTHIQSIRRNKSCVFTMCYPTIMLKMNE